MSFTRVRALAGAIGSLYLLATAAFAIRVFIKRIVTRRWNVDDYTFSAAFVRRLPKNTGVRCLAGNEAMLTNNTSLHLGLCRHSCHPDLRFCGPWLWSHHQPDYS